MIVVPLVPDDVAVGVLTVLDKRDGSGYDVGDLARGGDVRGARVDGHRRRAGSAGGADDRHRPPSLSQLRH